MHLERTWRCRVLVERVTCIGGHRDLDQGLPRVTSVPDLKQPMPVLPTPMEASGMSPVCRSAVVSAGLDAGSLSRTELWPATSTAPCSYSFHMPDFHKPRVRTTNRMPKMPPLSCACTTGPHR